MNAYLVWIPEMRTESHDVSGLEPPETVMPLVLIAAKTSGKAKYAGIKALERQRVADYPDDWTKTKVRSLKRGTSHPAGVIDAPQSPLWGRVHEILDHGGYPCDCAVEKPHRILAEGRLRVTRAVADPRGGLVVAECEGDTGTYHLGFDPIEREWRCTCDASAKFNNRCSHLQALQLVVAHRAGKHDGSGS